MRIRHVSKCQLFLVAILLVSTTPSVGQSLSVHDEILLAEGVSENYRERPPVPLLTDTVYNDLADYAMRDLLQTDYVVRSKLTYRWEWFVLDDPTPNAGSHIGGKLVVNAGLSKALGYDQGLWAAVLAHEIGHSLYRHPVVLLERNLSKQNRQSYTPQSAREALFTYLGLWGRRLLDLKVSRDEESKADEAGLFLLAAAGYPPDFGVVIHQRFRQAMGDRSGWEVFFTGTHPRHKTREDRTYKVYPRARKRHPSVRFDVADLMAEPGRYEADYVLACGIFHLGDQELFEATIKAIYDSCGIAAAFTCYSTWCPEDKKDASFFADPLKTMELCRDLTPHLILRHEYMLHDFSIYMYRVR